MTVSEEAILHVKHNKKELIRKFADVSVFVPVKDPIIYMMAGSPGAGKTEYSKRFIEELNAQAPNRRIVRIDTDEVRDWLPQYRKNNSSECQEAAALGVAKLFDYVLEKDQDALIDATFTPYEVAYRNVKRSLHHKRKVGVLYIYQDPIKAWQFTKAREISEGRPVPKDYFIKSFLDAKSNVNKIKKEFGKEVQLTLIVKNWNNLGVEKLYFNIDNVDGYIKKEYNLQSLKLTIDDSL